MAAARDDTREGTVDAEVVVEVEEEEAGFGWCGMAAVCPAVAGGTCGTVMSMTMVLSMPA